MEAFSILGGAEYLFSRRHDPKAFCALLGKLIPVKVAGDAEDPPMLRMAIDAPPDETREQWLARTARERGLPPPQLWVPQSGPLTEAIASRWCQEHCVRKPV